MLKPLSFALLSSLAVGAQAQLILPWHGDDASNYISSFQVRKTGPSGRANTLYITDPTNASDVLLANTLGLGRGAYFTITNPANNQMAFRGDSNGTGISVFGFMTGTGKAGAFRITNTNNTKEALLAQTDGSGPAMRMVAGTGLGADIAGGLRVTATNALNIIGGSTFSGSANFQNGFVSVGSRTTPITGQEIFGIHSNTTGYGGMYASTALDGTPFYGYYNGNIAWTYLGGSKWVLYNGGDRFSVGNDGASAIFSGSAATGLAVTQTGTGAALSATINNAGNSATAGLLTTNGTGKGLLVTMSNPGSVASGIQVNQTGIGSGISVQLTNNSNGGRGLDVLQSGVGPGVFSSSSGGNAVWGLTGSISAAGVIGDNQEGEAVVGRKGQRAGGASSSGIGAVVGRNDGVDGYGVRGFVTKDNAIGVLGQVGISGGLNGYAVRGNAENVAGTAIGVYGKAIGGSHIAALYAEGKMVATGTKSFLIDHPLDPENKMLYHYSMESDEPLNAYSGNVVTDANGRAWAVLPSYVQSINKDFRYQLTAIGTFSQAIVAKEIENGQFEIRTDKPHVKVSWRVEGVRNDRFVKKYGAPDEVAKPQAWKGKYLNPELFDKPASQGIFYVAPARDQLMSDTPAKIGTANGRPRK